MSSALRSSLLIVVMLGVVIAGSFLYSRMLRVSPTGTPAPSGDLAPAASRVDPRELHPELEKGIAAYGAERFEEATEHLRQIPSSDPSYLLALRNLGIVYTAMGQPEAALQSLSELCELQPDDADLLLHLAWAQYRLDRPFDAEVTTLRALEVDPEHARARYDVGYFRVVQGKLDEAARAYYRAVGQHGDRNRFSRAHDDLLELHTRRPELGAVHYVLAFMANTAGDSAEEVEELEHYLELEPEGNAADVARARLAEARPQ